MAEKCKCPKCGQEIKEKFVMIDGDVYLDGVQIPKEYVHSVETHFHGTYDGPGYSEIEIILRICK